MRCGWMGEITQNNNVVGERAGILKLSLIDMEIDSPLFLPLLHGLDIFIAQGNYCLKVELSEFGILLVLVCLVYQRQVRCERPPYSF
ncbi:unnamed protein product [Citrullus colocynthis]|uniref:Uncharacterized protein n=1 Tax=Citrullus colocynthis TaxID=252529 RepID=A0ABP0YZD9_9ROSI